MKMKSKVRGMTNFLWNVISLLIKASFPVDTTVDKSSENESGIRRPPGGKKNHEVEKLKYEM
jgi:hypothetical protein